MILKLLTYLHETTKYTQYLIGQQQRVDYLTTFTLIEIVEKGTPLPHEAKANVAKSLFNSM